MKTAVFLATHNKNKYLPNTLYAISRQKTSEPFEVCIIDDHSDKDPEPIIRNFLPEAKYVRLPKTIGFMFSHCYNMDIVSSEVENVIIMSSDVIMASEDTIKNLVSAVKYEAPVFGEVLNMKVPAKLHENYDAEIILALNKWGKVFSLKENIHTGRHRLSSWLFFLGAIKKDDLCTIEFNYNCCDGVLAPRMMDFKFKPEIHPRIRGIHQFHGKQVIYPCVIEETCKYYCARTVKRGVRPFYIDLAKLVDCEINTVVQHNKKKQEKRTNKSQAKKLFMLSVSDLEEQKRNKQGRRKIIKRKSIKRKQLW